MGFFVSWDCNKKKYIAACQTCFHKQVCPENIDFDAGSDFDSDMSYCRSEAEKVNRYLKNLLCTNCALKKINAGGWSTENPTQLGYYWFFGYTKIENGWIKLASPKDGMPKIEIGKITCIQQRDGEGTVLTYSTSNSILLISSTSENVYWKKIEPPTTDGLEFNFGSD
jgi:hypothetical protein